MALGLSILLVVLLALVLSAVVGLGVVGLLGWGAFKGLKALGNSVKRLLGAPAEPVRTDVPPMPAGVDEQASPSPSEPKREASSRASRDAQAQPRAHDFEYLDVEKGATAEHISQVMQGYVDDYLVGDYAHAVIEELSGAEFRRTRLFAEIDGRFAHGSLSWERFASTATEALDAILRNCALLANRVQAFDATDYARMEQFFASGGFSAHGDQDPMCLQRWKLLDDTKREMDEIRAANENLLLELGKLAAELGKLSSADFRDEGARIADEVSRLVDETKYYR